MAGGPLIPGLKEFDGPKRGVPGIVWLLLVVVVLAGLSVVFVGVFMGTGPLRSLGLVTDQLEPVAYRPTTDERVIQVAVAVPPAGLCETYPVDVASVESAARVSISANSVASRARPSASTEEA